jgi:1-acyl-sn-glycerol-3-phosphate acyltransferase
VVIFPEGMLRRRTEQPLRQFGQGVWHILQERPQTPVVVCWIEGGWGSYMSFYGGPPTKNKRPDWWRPIHIALDPPNVLDPDVLKDDRTTRGHLMHACLGARRWLNLPEVEPVAPFESDAPSPAPTTEAGT